MESTNEVPEKTYQFSFISELNELKEKNILVLDDFHLIQNPSIIALIDLLIKYPINKLHIFILTRKEPDFKVQRYLHKHHLQKIDTTELSLSKPEIERYAKTCLYKELSDEVTNTIAVKTDGWIMGLRQSILQLDNHLQGKENKG